MKLESEILLAWGIVPASGPMAIGMFSARARQLQIVPCPPHSPLHHSMQKVVGCLLRTSRCKLHAMPLLEEEHVIVRVSRSPKWKTLFRPPPPIPHIRCM